MAKTNNHEQEYLSLIFQNLDITNIGDAAGLSGSAVAGTLSVSLHTGDPGESGDQTTNECTYGSYARIDASRSVTSWTLSAASTMSNFVTLTFPQATSGVETATHVGLGTESTGAGKLIYKAALDNSLAISTGVTPQINDRGLDITES